MHRRYTVAIAMPGITPDASPFWTLIVDDEPAARELLAEQLLCHGFAVSGAARHRTVPTRGSLNDAMRSGAG